MKINPHQVIAQIICLAVLASGIASVNAQSIAAGERRYAVCARCHGINGRSINVNYPILAAQAAPYILLQLGAFKQSQRSDPDMNAIVSQLSDADMRDLAAFLEASEPYSSSYESEPIKAMRGKETAESAQCFSCHLGDSNSRGGEFPVIQGQHRNYVVKQLKDFKAGRRTNDYTGLMQKKTQSLTDTEIEDLGNYLATVHFVSLPRKRL